MVDYFKFNDAFNAYGAGQRAKQHVDNRKEKRETKRLADLHNEMLGQALESGDHNAAAVLAAKQGDINGYSKLANMPIEQQLRQARLDDIGIDNARQDAALDFRRQQGTQSNLRAQMEARLKAGRGPSYGKSPIYGTDENGNTVLLQLSDDGSAVQTPLPDGVNITPGIQKMDTGTEIVLVDTRSGEVISRTPKDIAGAAEQGVLGKSRAEQAVSAPKEAALLEQMMTTIDDLRDDPNRAQGTGKSSVFNSIPGTAGFDYQQKVNQLQGQSFLQARDKLKGAGALSDAESLKGEQAIARLSTAQSEEAYVEALNDLFDATNVLHGKLEKLSGASPANVPKGQTSTGLDWSVK